MLKKMRITRIIFLFSLYLVFMYDLIQQLAKMMKLLHLEDVQSAFLFCQKNEQSAGKMKTHLFSSSGCALSVQKRHFH